MTCVCDCRVSSTGCVDGVLWVCRALDTTGIMYSGVAAVFVEAGQFVSEADGLYEQSGLTNSPHGTQVAC